MAEERLANDKDRQVEVPEAVLDEVDSSADQDHYVAQQEGIKDGPLFGEEYNAKFLAELEKIKAEGFTTRKLNKTLSYSRMSFHIAKCSAFVWLPDCRNYYLTITFELYWF